MQPFEYVIITFDYGAILTPSVASSCRKQVYALTEYRLVPPASGVLEYLSKRMLAGTTREASLPYKFLIVSFSLTYGFLLQLLPVLQFKDRQNYLNYAENSAEILSNFATDGVLAVLANEPLWLLINSTLALVADPELVVRTIIFVSGSLFSYVLTRSNPENGLWLLLFLFVPQILKNFITHLRQGLGIALFFAGYFSSKPGRRSGIRGANHNFCVWFALFVCTNSFKSGKWALAATVPVRTTNS